jgi:hypothetical protein
MAMPRSSRRSKADSLNFRVDPALKTAFARATEAEDKSAAKALRVLTRLSAWSIVTLRLCRRRQ